jgi:hypothetical protein
MVGLPARGKTYIAQKGIVRTTFSSVNDSLLQIRILSFKIFPNCKCADTFNG